MAGNKSLPHSPAGAYNPWAIALVISLAPFMEVLDTTIASVSLSHIAGSLAASQDESTWILTSYLVSNTVVLPISGWLSQVFGRKRFYLICVAVFTASSVGCAFATSLPMMLIARIFQGLGGGGLQPTTQSMLADSFPPAKRSQAFALYGLTVIVAPASGPLIGGWLTDNLSWHWIFLINLPIGLIAFMLISVFVSEPKALVEDRKQLLRKGLKLDYLGLCLVALGFGTLQVFLDKFQEDDGFSSSFILGLFAIWTISLSLLAVWEWDHPRPVINIRLFKIRNFAIGCTLLFFVGFVLLSSIQLFPQFTQSLLGYNSQTAGLALLSGGLGTILIMPAVGFISGRLVPPKWLLVGGFIMIGYGLLLQSWLPTDASFYDVSFNWAVQVSALPFLFIPANAAAYVGVPPDRNGEASALLNQARNLGGSIGISFVNTGLAWRTQFHHARLVEAVTPYGSLHGLAVSQIMPIVQTQASFLGYLDMFRIVGIAALAVLPVILFLKSTPKAAA